MFYLKIFIIFELCSFFAALNISAADEKAIPIANIDGGISTIAGGCVSVITGDYLEHSRDLVIPGPEPLIFERFYASSDYETGSLYMGWRHNHDSSIALNGDVDRKNTSFAYYTEASGRSAKFANEEDHVLTLKSGRTSRGLTNCGMGSISARTNLANTRIRYHRKSDLVEVHSGSGAKSQFKFSDNVQKHYLKSEKRINGLMTGYTYHHHDKSMLERITLSNSSGLREYSSIHIADSPRLELSGNPKIEIQASDGRKVTYWLQKFKPTKKDKERGINSRYHIVDVYSQDAPRQFYEYATKSDLDSEHIIRSSKPRTLSRN